MRPLLALLSLTALLVAGCASTPAPAEPTLLVSEEEFEGLEATQTTGVIRGVVVDEAVRPLAGALISLAGAPPRNATSSEAGAFGFSALEPGTYFMTVSKIGYFAVQSSVEVIAGVEEPSITKILLVANPAANPYYSVVTWNGYLECSMRAGTGGLAGSVGLNACSASDEVFANQNAEFVLAPFDRIPELLQAEAVWESTQSVGSGLSFVVGPPSCADVKYDRADGPSALVIKMNATDLADPDIEFNPVDGICFRMFSYTSEETAHFAGLVVNQRFEGYFHAFYNFLPPEDWQFSVNGAPEIPN